MDAHNDFYAYWLSYFSQDQFELDPLIPAIPPYETVPFLNHYQPLPTIPTHSTIPAAPYDSLIDWTSVVHAPRQAPLPEQWIDTPTVTNTSTVSTPLPTSDHGVGDDNISPKRSFESMRSTEEPETELAAKKIRSDEGHSHGSRSPPNNRMTNRVTGACLCCQMRTNKHACPAGPDVAGPCMPCLRKATVLSPAICRRAKFGDVEIFRLGPSKDFATTLRWLRKESISTSDPQKALWKPIENLPKKKSRQPSAGFKTLRLSQGHTSQTLNLRVQEFDPAKDDKQNFTWFNNGVEHTYYCPPYAIADRDHAKEEIRQFINGNIENYIDTLLPESTDMGVAFIRMVFRTALDRARESSLVTMALRFWVAGRFIESPWCIKGDETLGMLPDVDYCSPYFDKVPVTPMMDFQIDNIVIHEHLKKLLHDIRKSMRQKIMPIKKDDWFDIHLTTFILLHHVDLTMKHDMDFAAQHDLSHRKFSNKPLIDMVTFGANTLLEYFQHEKGHFPLSAPWGEVESSYSFSGPQKQYLLSVRKMIRQINNPRQAGDDLFWTAQVHAGNWQPAVVVAA